MYILIYRWLNKDVKLEDYLLEYDTRTKTLMSQNEEGIVIVEYRDLDGTVIHFEEPEFSETTGRKLHKVVGKAGNLPSNCSSIATSNTKLDIVAIDFAGKILKTKF